MWAVTVFCDKIPNLHHSTSEDHCGLEKPVQWAIKALLKVVGRWEEVRGSFESFPIILRPQFPFAQDTISIESFLLQVLVGTVGLNFGNMFAFHISSDNLALEPDHGHFYGIYSSSISCSPHICETINIYLKILSYFHILFGMSTPPSLYNNAQHTAQKTPPHSWISESVIHTNRTFVWLQNVGAKWIYCTGLMNTTATVQPLFLYWENCFSR